MLTSEQKFVAYWAPRKGTEAAKISWRMMVYQLRGRALMFVAVPTSIIGGKLGLPVLLGIGIACLVLGFGYAVASMVKLRESNKAASAALGMRLGFLHVAPPPRTTEHYLQWCHKHGITPYAADDATPYNSATSPHPPPPAQTT